MNIILPYFRNRGLSPVICRSFGVSSAYSAKYSCKLLVVGGGTGGCTIASKFSRKLKKGSIIVLEPSEDHYYQPLFTLVGAGVTQVSSIRRSEGSVLPAPAKWIKDYATKIDAAHNYVTTMKGDTIQYEYIVIAVGLVNDYARIPGLSEALKEKISGVSTIFSHDYCEKTWSDMKGFRGGNAIFTYPDSLIKCPGAPQKIAYLADAYFTKTNIRSKTDIMYNTCLPVIFGVKKYADALLKVVERKNIKVNYKTVLKEVKHDSKEAVFAKKDETGEMDCFTVPYNMLHVAPPMKTPDFLSCAPDITDKQGFLEVDKYTLQSKKYPNMYGLGDCTNTPNSKTAAAIAKQCWVLEYNLLSTMKKDSPKAKYDGYGACPLLTEYGKCILAEFIYDGVVHETLPFNQAVESTIAYYMKKDLFPFLYWNLMLKGYYHGPETVRRIINPFKFN